MKKILLLLFLFICAFGHIASAGDEYVFNRIDAQANLSHSAVLSMYQDRQGLMWFGTYDGLNCYDGKNMSVFRSESPQSTGLTNNVIATVSQADDNCIWCATDYMLNKFSQETFTTEIYEFSEDYTVHSNSLGNTYLICRDSLYYYNTAVKDFIQIGSGFRDATALAARKTFVSMNGEFWFFSEESGRVRIFSVSSFDEEPENVKVSERFSEFHNKGIKDVFWQEGKVTFLDVNYDLFMYDSENRTKFFIRNIASLIEQYGSISGISPLYDDIYIGFSVNGLVRLNSAEEYKESMIDKDIRIYGLRVDVEQGVLWIATDGQGAVSYNKENNIAQGIHLPQISSGLSRQVRSIMTDENGNLWFGTKGDGLIKISSYKSAFQTDGRVEAEVILPDLRIDAEDYVRSTREFQVYSMKESAYRDGFWVGTGSNGLYFYSTEDDRLEAVTNSTGIPLREIHAIVEHGDSELYVASAITGLHHLTLGKTHGGGIEIMTSENHPIYNNSRHVEQFFPMVAQGDSLLWIGSRTDGLVKFDCRTEEHWTMSLKSLTNQVSDDVLSLCLSPSGILYVGTTAGLISLDVSDNQSETEYVGREDGLLNDMIHGIVEDEKGMLWLSTNKGLAKYNPLSGIVHNYYYSSGVIIGEFSDDAYYKCNHTGDVFFGGVNGFLKLNKDNDTYTEFNRDLLLRGLSVGRQEVKLADYLRIDRNGTKSLVLDGSRVSFSLFYGVPDFLSGSDIEYSYVLEGHNDYWSVFSSGNEARFNSVDAGRYIFKVRYKKDVFSTDFKVFSIPVRVVPPWYLSQYAMLAYLLILVLLVFFVFRRARRSVLLHRSEKQPVGKIPDTGEDIMDRMAVLYRCCDRLRAEELSYEERLNVAELMRDTMSGILNGGYSDEELQSKIPLHFMVANTEVLSDVSYEVMTALVNAGHDVSSINSVFPHPSSSYPIYSNAFKRLLYGLYGCFASTDIPSVSVSFEKDEKRWLNIVVRSSWEYVWTAYDNINTLYRQIIERMGAEMKCVDKGASSSLKIIFPPADIAEVDNTKNSIVLLGQTSDLTWLISDMLSSSYKVSVFNDPDAAFSFMQKENVLLLMVDMRLFEGKETQFIESLYRNHTIAGKVSFLPMFTWNTDQNVCRELILISDAYMMLPYDILMLKNVVHKAIYGKGSISDVNVEDLFGAGMSPSDTEFVAKVLEIIEANLEREDLGTSLVADRMALSTSSFYRKFKKVTGVSLEVLIKNYRLEKASILLKDTNLSIADVITDVGISSRSYFYKEFSKKYGMTPKEYRDNLCSELT